MRVTSVKATVSSGGVGLRSTTCVLDPVNVATQLVRDVPGGSSRGPWFVPLLPSLP